MASQTTASQSVIHSSKHKHKH